MKTKLTNRIKKSLGYLLVISLFCLSAFVIAGCSSASGKAKKKKSEKQEEVAEESAAKEAENSEESKEEEKPEANASAEDEKHDDKKADDKKGKNGKSDDKSAHGKDDKEKGPSADQVWADLMRGNKLFRQGKYSAGNLLAERPVLAKGQKPKAIILGCSDSRVPAELIFGQNTGDIFVVRDAGNIVDELALGSMEYAVEHLGAKVLVVLGHDSCGAVAATVSGEKMPTKNLQAIVDKISPALKDSSACPIGGKMNPSCVEINVRQTAKNAVSLSPIIKKAQEEGLTIIQAIYHFDTGEVQRID